MALTNCPSCGKEISDKAAKCPACEFDLTTIHPPETPDPVFCSECKAEIPADAQVCPNCGCPQTPKKATPLGKLQPYLEKAKKSPAFEKCRGFFNSRKKTALFSAGVVCLVILGIVIGGNVKASRAASKYQTNLNGVVGLMLQGATQAESSGNLIKSVWYNTIYKKTNSETDAFTKKKGSFNKDFNTSLSTLFSDAKFKITINYIKSNQSSVDSRMKSLKNPPKGSEEAYAALKDLYNAYNELTGLVIDPSGNLTTFSSRFNNADTAMSNYYKAMKIYIQ